MTRAVGAARSTRPLLWTAVCAIGVCCAPGTTESFGAEGQVIGADPKLLKTTVDRAIVRYEVMAVKDQAYYAGPGADPEKNKLDLYLPKGKQGFPILVFVHGGGYQKGDRKEGEILGQVFAARGVGAAVISYRLYPQVKHPGQVQDVARAFAWVKANADRQGGRSSAIFVGGHSAGAHLAALLATDESYLQAEALSLKDIRGVVALSGGYRIQSRSARRCSAAKRSCGRLRRSRTSSATIRPF